ncbi:MAG: glycosyltransferase [Dysgonamonadaceae bacterium]|jgi:glycosyltransferase involved in cell wall biosynthesis|nr:glycosyltransferase [Dysgonamonadaceae bacterium]
MKKISIIIPVYNVAKYIIRCLDSVINQTYPNIECILVDDCGQDDSIALAEQRIKEYSGTIEFKILHHEHNRGLSVARNTGTMDATGEYIYYLDSDDEIIPHCIETLVALVEKYPGVEMVQGNTQTIPEPLPESDWRNIAYRHYPEYVDDNLWVRAHFEGRNDIPMNAWNKLIKRNFIFENKYFFKEGIIHEDELWMFYIVKRLKTVAFTIEYTYIHYIIDGSIIRSKDPYPSINSWYFILNEIFSSNNNLSKKCMQKYLSILCFYVNRINFATREKILYPLYKDLLRRLLKKEWHNDKSFLISMLYLLYTPRCILRSRTGKKISHILLKIEQYI